MKIKSLCSLGIAALALFTGITTGFAEAKIPAVGDQAPLIEGRDQTNKHWELANLIGKQVVLLYFYPKDATPGCTREACTFRDRIGDMREHNVQVIGVSFDSAESHQAFTAANHLNFPLLVDVQGKIADAYGVRMAGKNMARRVSFLIGLDGKIIHVTDNRDAGVHLQEMSQAVTALPAKK